MKTTESMQAMNSFYQDHNLDFSTLFSELFRKIQLSHFFRLPAYFLIKYKN